MGFTLAEVLITLVIIGVIAAMTIPTLINKTNNQEYVSRLKKVYATLSAATNRIIFEKGTPNSTLGGWSSSPEALLDIYKTKLMVADECVPSNGCTPNDSYKQLNNVNSNYNIGLRPKLVLNDGTFLFFWLEPDAYSCNYNSYGSFNACGEIYEDINGKKGPNKWGRDFFYFVIKENGLVPAGCDGNSSDCNKNGNEYTCACKVIRENAINY